jgi:hypothetical protein
MTHSAEGSPGNAEAEAAKSDQVGSGANPSSRLEHDKTFSTLAARLALKGFAIYPLAAGGFLIARHDRSVHAPDCKAVADFLRELEGTTSGVTTPPSQAKPRRKVE